jgi:spore cortex biosynthesis protein YabQ
MIVPETFFSVNEELTLFGISVAAGAVIGAVYDILRAFRLTVPHGIWLTAVEDIAFLSCYAVFLTAFASVEALGELRVYYMIGNAVGAVLYFFTVGRIVMRIFGKISGFTAKIWNMITAPLYHFNIFICKKAMAKFVGCSKIFVKYIEKLKMLLPKLPGMMYNKTENKKRKNVDTVAEKDQN